MQVNHSSQSVPEKTDPTSPPIEEIKDSASKYPLSKFEYDLFKDEDNVVLPVVRVKHIGSTNKNERWKIFGDNKLLCIVDGSKLTKKEKEFLRTIEGVSFLIAQCKAGIKSFSALKKALKKVVA